MMVTLTAGLLAATFVGAPAEQLAPKALLSTDRASSASPMTSHRWSAFQVPKKTSGQRPRVGVTTEVPAMQVVDPTAGFGATQIAALTNGGVVWEMS